MAMPRVRRLASVAVVASLAVAGLSACRSEPSVAAYVGAGRISEARVQQVWDQAYDAVNAQRAAGAAPAEAASPDAAGDTQAVAMPITRGDVVRALISADVLGRVARQQNVTLPADLRLSDYANRVRVPADTDYVRLYAEADALVSLLRAEAQGAPEPTNADLREVYDVLAADQLAGGATFEDFKAQLPEQNRQLVRSAVAVRNEINEVAGSLRIRVNPRYRPLDIAILNYQTQNGELRPLLVAPLGANDATAPVSSAG